MLGEHTHKVLSELGYTAGSITDMLKPVPGQRFPPATSTRSFLDLGKLPGGKAFAVVEMLQEGDTFGHSNKSVPVVKAAASAARQPGPGAAPGPMAGIKVVELCGGVMGTWRSWAIPTGRGLSPRFRCSVYTYAPSGCLVRADGQTKPD